MSAEHVVGVMHGDDDRPSPVVLLLATEGVQTVVPLARIECIRVGEARDETRILLRNGDQIVHPVALVDDELAVVMRALVAYWRS